jgi:hypothetical protein
MFRPKGTNRPGKSYSELCEYCKALKDENKKLKEEVKYLKNLVFNPSPPEPKILKFVPKSPKAS